ncbi:BCD family MFS transporter [Methylopila turkensis]|uniref:Bacteriochlorophyll synthase n=1 Tax=Methylopila turkensis TaxID=1437816 RepID=A0A9W6JLF7_9HYPH|nr:BCD family MFS transporter [Methylopila turkensis]GLK78299.1 bacteriochlorophyll synthase [Methylopila turkensis]
MSPAFTWAQILRVGLAQAALGTVVVLTTSTLNRVMAIELALPALLPGLLVALHHAVQLARPRWGFGSDRGGRRTPWIIGGMAILSLGGVGSAVATAAMAEHIVFGAALGVAAFTAIGVGVGACGTNLLAMLATHVGEGRRAAAATIVWVMMIAGFVVTTAAAGQLLDPFSLERLVMVCAGVSGIAFVVCVGAMWRLEPPSGARQPAAHATGCFSAALADIWSDRSVRRFTLFVFASMLAYSTQDLILEPFAGVVFVMTPGETTSLSGLQNGGVLAGMVTVALATGLFGETPGGLLKSWIVAGCLASSAALAVIAFGGAAGDGFPIRAACFALGFANGAFATAAIGSMMGLAGQGDPRTRGVRMGLWGAAQAIGFALGGLMGALLADILRTALGSPGDAYAIVFGIDAALFLACALVALRLDGRRADAPAETLITDPALSSI